MGILIPLVIIFFTCLIIWRACDGFEIASEYIGRNMSEGVRGGTINAISSSIPELFTTLIALFVLGNLEGFSIGLGTTAGSALFNGMIIPAACILTVIGTVVVGIHVTSVNVSSKVILRDGLSLIACEFVLILLINGTVLYWWQGLLLMLMYIAYFAYMLLSMKAKQEEEEEQAEEEEESDDGDESSNGIFYWLSGGPLLDLERWFVRDHHQEQIKSESWNAWPLLLSATSLIGIACWMLVKACEWLGTGAGNDAEPHYELFGYTLEGLGMPAMFVAVIFASMATSVPDTVISIRDAKDGDYDDAVANALGSNIFDICFALGFPLFLYTLINGPMTVAQNVADQSAELRLLLLALTVCGFFVYFVGKRGTASDGTKYIEMKRGKAILLLLIYVLFVFFIVGRSQQWSWAASIAATLQNILELLPLAS